MSQTNPNPPGKLNPITAMHKLNCIAAMAVLAEGTFDETPKQQYLRGRLIAEIVATNEVLGAAEQKLPNATVEKAIAMKWAELWKKTERELVIRKVKL